MRAPRALGLDNAPRYAYGVAGVLVLALVYAAVLIGILLPQVPVDARTPAGQILQLIVFTGAAIVLFFLRSSDATAALSVLALALSGIANASPARAFVWSGRFGEFVTGTSWIAGPVAFPVVALAILYFPSKSPLLNKYPALHTVPWITAAPMLVLGVARALHQWGFDALAPVVAWDASHPALYYASFSAALAVNVAVIIEGIYRYRFNHNANERRRIRMALYTAVPGVLAYVVKEGVPAAWEIASIQPPAYGPAWIAVLDALVLLPAFGLVYAVGVERVLGPRVVLRRSLQYALAARSMTIVALLPAIPLVAMLIDDRQLTVGDVVLQKGLAYVALIAMIVAAFWYRERARSWLDQRFFREEYDARKILISLAGRVRFETDPKDLADLVVKQLDGALHPEMAAFIVDGIEAGWLSPVAALHGNIEPLPSDSGLVAMLRWSDQPLELFLQDPRSPVRRLPTEEQSWLERTGASLLVPVVDAEKALIAAIVLGEKLSEEAYTDEDRQLLASIATQVGLGFDVARLRRRIDSSVATDSSTTHRIARNSQPMMQCPTCGRCEEAGTIRCPADGTLMEAVPAVPRVVDNKYRIEQLLARGGMGAVYRARDVRLDRLVALKVVRAELLGDADARQRFRREAQIVAGLQHPSIVSIFDYGTFADGGAYLVMELVRGEDLRRVLQREGWVEPDRALLILNAVCGAMEVAHREGVLHRDLKPENILLPGGPVVAKVLDFGVAKVVREDIGERETIAADGSLITAPGMIIGTPAYMAPEQLRGLALDARCDIFSLGVIAFEMLTGELPFGRGTLADIVLAHARGVPAFPANHTIPLPLEDAIRAALQLDPDSRPLSVHAFAQLLAS
jgi:eukaryotic-like serine/threonine-protein kinase